MGVGRVWDTLGVKEYETLGVAFAALALEAARKQVCGGSKLNIWDESKYFTLTKTMRQVNFSDLFYVSPSFYYTPSKRMLLCFDLLTTDFTTITKVSRL